MPDKKDLTRREVVQMAGAVTAAAAVTKLAGAPAIQKVKAANNQIQYGMIGTGSRGTYLLRHLKGVDTGNCAALCDVWEPSLNEAANTIGTTPRSTKTIASCYRTKMWTRLLSRLLFLNTSQ